MFSVGDSRLVRLPPSEVWTVSPSQIAKKAETTSSILEKDPRVEPLLGDNIAFINVLGTTKSTFDSSSGAVAQKPISSKEFEIGRNAYAARFERNKISSDTTTPRVIAATGYAGNGLIYSLVSPFSQHKAPVISINASAVGSRLAVLQFAETKRMPTKFLSSYSRSNRHWGSFWGPGWWLYSQHKLRTS
jgi:hypothetical protein